MNENDNSSADSEATRFIPSPGRKVAAEAPVAPVLAQFEQASSRSIPFDLDAIAGLNAIVSAANPILAAVPRIRTQVRHPNPGQLRESMLERMAKFEQLARSRGVSPEDVLIARYALCTLVDEAVAATPWGGTADWANRSLLVTFHQETGGGEKFFQILNKLAENPAGKIDLIELFYVCLALGFEGRFRILDNGRAQLESLREKVALLIRNVRGEHERDLSPHWRGEQTKTGNVLSFFTLWATMAGVAVLLVVVYALMNFSLNGASDEIEYGKLRASVPKPKVVAAAPVVVTPRLAKFLEPEIAQKLVEVRDEPNRSTVSILGDGLFDSGSATVRDQYQPVLIRIAEALNAVPGSVLVTGHTDDRPSRSIRFPSNWHLSRVRAENVAHLLQQKVTQPGRVNAEGRGDSEPVAANDTDAGRAKNRRVEIILQTTE